MLYYKHKIIFIFLKTILTKGFGDGNIGYHSD